MPIGVGLLVAGLVAIAAGLLLPQLLGSFSERERLILALIEVLCLALLALGIVVMARRLRASHQVLWELARRDELTGVGNYRALNERLVEEVSRHRRRGREFALILIDLDGFKQVNDRHGHALGDQLLHAVGQRIQQCVRRTDTVARMGGDEFVVLLGGVEQAGDAYAIAESIRASLARPFALDGARVQVSASIGVALHPEHGTEKKSLLRSADTAMYAAKRQGGNRLVARGQGAPAGH